jgi:hypothetical protein
MYLSYYRKSTFQNVAMASVEISYISFAAVLHYIDIIFPFYEL